MVETIDEKGSWLAGLIDGDGCLTACLKSPVPGSNKRLVLGFEIAQTSRDTLDFANEILTGLGGNCYIVHKPVRIKKDGYPRQAMYVLMTHKLKNLEILTNILGDKLIDKNKKRKLDIMREYISQKTRFKIDLNWETEIYNKFHEFRTAKGRNNEQSKS